MNKIPFKLESFNPLVTELLVEIHATQTATAHLVMDFMIHHGMNEDEIEKRFNADYAKFYQERMDALYSKYGHFDLGDIK